jgi:hypothetical protein
MVTDCEGAFVVEPMRFLWPSEAKRAAKSNPQACDICSPLEINETCEHKLVDGR